MARLFISKDHSYKTRNEEKIDFYKKIFIAYEGVVGEPRYFKMLRDKINSLPSYTVEIFSLDRVRTDGNGHPIHVKNGLTEYYDEHLKKSFDKKMDSLWIVFDIDQHFKGTTELTPEEEYKKFLSNLKTSNNVKINAAVSKPCFEIWLILHYKMADELDLDLIQENKKISKRSTYIKKLLKEIKKDQPNYSECINEAIQNSNSDLLTTSNHEMFHKVGTSVTKLLEGIF